MLSDNLYKPLNLLSLLLIPFSYVFCGIVFLRRWLYRLELFKSVKFDVPVIVVGNITVGGTGKTPLVIALAEALKEKGLKPGIVSRGYGAKIRTPTPVSEDSHYNEVGDEPLLIARRTNCPVVVYRKRVEAVRYLLSHFDCDIVICDDGLQHYALQRDIEIVVVDGQRQFGNGFCLPAGPLREPVSRLKTVNFIIVNGGGRIKAKVSAPIYTMNLTPQKILSVSDFKTEIEPTLLKTKIVHACAGIGHPKRFFETLRAMKLRIFEHLFPDHYPFRKEDFNFGEDALILMTEKDAVKCTSFADNRFMFLKVDAMLDADFFDQLSF